MRRPLLAAVLTTLLAALLLLAAACGDDGDEDATSGDGGADGGETTAEGGGPDASVDLGADGRPEVTLVVGDGSFAPARVRAAPGARVTVDLRSDSSIEHTFTVEGGDVDQLVEPGSDERVEVALPEEDTVTFYCRFHRDAGMEGAFEVAGSSPDDGGNRDGDGGTTTTGAPAVGGYGY